MTDGDQVDATLMALPQEFDLGLGYSQYRER